MLFVGKKVFCSILKEKVSRSLSSPLSATGQAIHISCMGLGDSDLRKSRYESSSLYWWKEQVRRQVELWPRDKEGTKKFEKNAKETRDAGRIQFKNLIVLPRFARV